MNVFNKGYIFKYTCLLLVSFLFCRSATATLIGDTVYLHNGWYYEPGLYITENGIEHLEGIQLDFFNDPIEIGPIASGSSDAVNPTDYNFTSPAFNFEESSFTMYWGPIFHWGDNDGNFNGLIITDINYSSSSVISGFSLSSELYEGFTSTDTWDFDPGRITYTDNAIYLDFHGLKFFNSHMTVNVQFSEVPLPAATWLFLSGLISMVGILSVRPRIKLT